MQQHKPSSVTRSRLIGFQLVEVDDLNVGQMGALLAHVKLSCTQDLGSIPRGASGYDAVAVGELEP
jgi:hypothetical protein